MEAVTAYMRVKTLVFKDSYSLLGTWVNAKPLEQMAMRLLCNLDLVCYYGCCGLTLPQGFPRLSNLRIGVSSFCLAIGHDKFPWLDDYSDKEILNL